jgi:hypothetical protein
MKQTAGGGGYGPHSFGSGHGSVAGSYGQGNEPSDSIKDGNFLTTDVFSRIYLHRALTTTRTIIHTIDINSESISFRLFHGKDEMSV